MKVKMIPHESQLKTGVSGIMTVVRKWFKYLPRYGVELVGPKDDDFDILAVHAGMTDHFPSGVPLCSHTHGLYWSSDYRAAKWEFATNKAVIDCCRHASAITVPSNWVAEPFMRDMRITPSVIPHGVDWDEWQHTKPNDGYVLAYAKNRAYDDVCSPTFVVELAKRFPKVKFVATFAPKGIPPNVLVTGIVPHEQMKDIIQRASIVISPLKETFGVLTLEAFASGTPVLGYAHGGNLDLIQHQENGYLARPNNMDELCAGLIYCLEHRDELSIVAKESAKRWTWEVACSKLAATYESVLQPEKPTVAVVIPSYKYGTEEKLGRAIRSILAQTYQYITNIIVVDDGSPDSGSTESLVRDYQSRDNRIEYIRQENAGVAVARNRGIDRARSTYILCLDADDAIESEWVRACVEPLEKDRSLGIAYTGLMTCTPTGMRQPSPWPHKFDPAAHFQRQNQIPTAALFRRECWERVGGYRSRYCPGGAGSEDGEFFTRILAAGYGAIQATEAPLFLYSFGQGNVSGNPKYHEVDWLALHPYVQDGQHPFASVAPAKHFAHPVRQYDEPVISVIIPVGPGHKGQIFNALDSLEAQTMRKWEVIVVDDSGDPDESWAFDGVENALAAYPYVRLVTTPGKMGAGYARNRGVEAARAPLILYLDADDNLLDNNALSILLDAWHKSGGIVYSDYASKSFVDKDFRATLNRMGRMMDDSQFEKGGLVMYYTKALDYDCERAVRQPESQDPDKNYIWNLITSLMPRQYHFDIGGFDESMKSWEDWDYWIRLAKAGKCFTHLEAPLVCYRFYTGTRRESGMQIHQNLLQYLLKKYKGVDSMACGCGKQKAMAVAQPPAAPGGGGVDSEMVLIRYNSPNRGEHRVVGASVFPEQIGPSMIPTNHGFSFDYHRHAQGDLFYVHQSDIRYNPDLYQVVELPPSPEETAQRVVESFHQSDSVPEPKDAGGPVDVSNLIPEPEEKQFDLQSLPGVTKAIAIQLQDKGFATPDKLVELGEAGLMEQQIEGMSEKRAHTIVAGAKKLAVAQPAVAP